MLRVGDKAPNFSLPDSDMEIRTLSHFSDRNLVLYFYPKDDTPGCTIQATDFSELIDEFEALGARVVGVSPDDCFSHQAFRDKLGLKVTLLADPDKEACTRYGVYQEKEKDGVKKMGVIRSTFIIDRKRHVRHVEYGVSPKGHAQHLIEILRKLPAE